MTGNIETENIRFTEKPVLSVETATPVCSVALRLPDGTVHELRSEGKGVHSEQTFVYIDRLLAREKLAVNDLGAVIISAGPGSYTGLRVASSAVKGLLFQTEVPLYACQTLGAIALGAMYAARGMHDAYATSVIRPEFAIQPTSTIQLTSTIRSTPASRHTPDPRHKSAIRKSDAEPGADESLSGSSFVPEDRSAVPADGTMRLSGCDAVIDARRNHLYHQSWRFLGDGLEPESEVQVRELEEILEWWKSGRLVVGTGLERLKEIASDVAGRSEKMSVLPYQNLISASNILTFPDRCSGARMGHLIKKVAPEHFEPYYYTGL